MTLSIHCTKSLTSWRDALCVLVMLFFAGKDAYADNQSELFSLKEPLYAGRGNGHEELLGDQIVCVQILGGKMPTILLSISMPDSGQVLSVRAPITHDRNGVVTFHFDDDSWGNSGDGTLKRRGKIAELTIKQTGAQPDADKNIRRNYGNYSLAAGSCN